MANNSMKAMTTHLPEGDALAPLAYIAPITYSVEAIAIPPPMKSGRRPSRSMSSAERYQRSSAMATSVTHRSSRRWWWR